MSEEEEEEGSCVVILLMESQCFSDINGASVRSASRRLAWRTSSTQPVRAPPPSTTPTLSVLQQRSPELPRARFINLTNHLPLRRFITLHNLPQRGR